MRHSHFTGSSHSPNLFANSRLTANKIDNAICCSGRGGLSSHDLIRIELRKSIKLTEHGLSRIGVRRLRRSYLKPLFGLATTLRTLKRAAIWSRVVSTSSLPLPSATAVHRPWTGISWVSCVGIHGQKRRGLRGSAAAAKEYSCCQKCSYRGVESSRGSGQKSHRVVSIVVDGWTSDKMDVVGRRNLMCQRLGSRSAILTKPIPTTLLACIQPDSRAHWQRRPGHLRGRCSRSCEIPSKES